MIVVLARPLLFICHIDMEFAIYIKKARSNDLANLLTLGERANKVSVRLAGFENETGLSTTSTLSVLPVGVLSLNHPGIPGWSLPLSVLLNCGKSLMPCC